MEFKQPSYPHFPLYTWGFLIPTHCYIFSNSFPTVLPQLDFVCQQQLLTLCLKLGRDDNSREKGEQPCHSMPHLALIGLLEKSQQRSVPCSETQDAQLFSTPVPHSRTKFLFTIFKRLPSVSFIFIIFYFPQIIEQNRQVDIHPVIHSVVMDCQLFARTLYERMEHTAIFLLKELSVLSRKKRNKRS